MVNILRVGPPSSMIKLGHMSRTLSNDFVFKKTVAASQAIHS